MLLVGWSPLEKGFVIRLFDKCQQQGLECNDVVRNALDALKQENISSGVIDSFIGVLDNPTLSRETKIRILRAINAGPEPRQVESYFDFEDTFVFKIGPDTPGSYFAPVFRASKLPDENTYYGANRSVRNAAHAALKRSGLEK